MLITEVAVNILFSFFPFFRLQIFGLFLRPFHSGERFFMVMVSFSMRHNYFSSRENHCHLLFSLVSITKCVFFLLLSVGRFKYFIWLLGTSVLPNISSNFDPLHYVAKAIFFSSIIEIIDDVLGGYWVHTYFCWWCAHDFHCFVHFVSKMCNTQRENWPHWNGYCSIWCKANGCYVKYDVIFNDRTNWKTHTWMDSRRDKRGSFWERKETKYECEAELFGILTTTTVLTLCWTLWRLKTLTNTLSNHSRRRLKCTKALNKSHWVLLHNKVHSLWIRFVWSWWWWLWAEGDYDSFYILLHFLLFAFHWPILIAI